MAQIGHTDRLSLSVCTYAGGAFDVIIRDPDTLEELTFSGERALLDDEFEFINRVAPACVFTRYVRETPRD